MAPGTTRGCLFDEYIDADTPSKRAAKPLFKRLHSGRCLGVFGGRDTASRRRTAGSHQGKPENGRDLIRCCTVVPIDQDGVQEGGILDFFFDAGPD